MGKLGILDAERFANLLLLGIERRHGTPEAAFLHRGLLADQLIESLSLVYQMPQGTAEYNWLFRVCEVVSGADEPWFRNFVIEDDNPDISTSKRMQLWLTSVGGALPKNE